MRYASCFKGPALSGLVLLGGIFCNGALPARSDTLPDSNEMHESVVRILVDTDKGQVSGTGFIVDGRGVIATNQHVIDGAKQIQVQFLANGKPISVGARMIAADPARVEPLAAKRLQVNDQLTRMEQDALNRDAAYLTAKRRFDRATAIRDVIRDESKPAAAARPAASITTNRVPPPSNSGTTGATQTNAPTGR